MKILAVADEESKYLWEYYEPSKLRDIDLIIGCGDLSRHYMNFLSDAAPVPVLYVHGNHDASYDRATPNTLSFNSISPVCAPVILYVLTFGIIFYPPSLDNY